MKNNYFTICLLIIVASFCIFATSKNTEESPSVSVTTKNQFPCMVGDVITYEIKICSHEALETIHIQPSVKGANSESVMHIKFEKNVKCKTVVYKYKVPRGSKQNVVSLSIKINSIKSSLEHNENFTVFNTHAGVEPKGKRVRGFDAEQRHVACALRLQNDLSALFEIARQQRCCTGQLSQ